MASQGQGISIPISLQISNLQSVVNMLQSKLSNLKVGTAGFKSLQNIITTIQKDIDKLTTQTDKPFVSANQFTAADRTVNKLEEDLDRVQIAVSRIKFSDLELDPSQAAELKAFETQIESIKNSLKTVKETAKQAFLDSDVGKGWAHDHAEATTQTLSQLTAAITKEVSTQRQALESAEKAVTDYQQAIQVSKNINNFMSKRSGHQLSEATMGKELFNEIFKTDEQGQVLKFQNGGRTLLQQWLQQQFNLDSATVQNLTKDAGSAVVEAFAEIGGKVEAALKAQQIKLRNAATEQKTTTNNGSTLEAAVKEKTEKLNQAEAVQAQMVASNTSVSASEAQLRAELEQTKAQLAEYKERLAEAARTNPDWANSNKQANAALEQLKSTLNQTNAQFLQQQRVMQNFNSMKMAVVNFMGFNQVLNITRKAVREAINHIRELDTVMNGIAIVTDMSTGDLWNQIDQYSKMAQAYGVSITGAYEVSQIYYQQGLETADVMTLTNETLKLAKISGLDYATTTDYMTTAIRGFKMEMSDASTVVDVYSNLAAHTAVSQEELAVAMSKTASSMEGVGATFEEASAMIGTMVAVTRESATNIGSAMKSIASRYGELTKDPTKLVDEEGEAMAFNKVDAALQSVGISMRTVDGQFREFTDVIVELGEKWEQLDSTQQRYIATQFAGNRQQSRFLALVSNVDLLKSNLDVARNSEDTGTLQALKALDSIQSKTEQVRVAYQQFYTTIGVEDVWKSFLDGTKNVINTLNGLPKLFGKLPISAINAVGSIIVVIKNLGLSLLSTVAKSIGNSLATGFQQAVPQAKEGAENWFNTAVNTIKGKTGEAQAAGQAIGNALNKGLEGTRGLTAWGANNITKGQANNWSLTAKFASYQGATKEQSQKAWDFLATDMQKAGVLTTEGFNIIKAGGTDALNLIERIRTAILGEGNAAAESNSKLASWSAAHQKGLSSLQAFGSALNLVAMAIDTSTQGGKQLSGVFMTVSGVIVATTAAIKAAGDAANGIPWVAIASGAVSAISGIMTIIKSFSLEAQLEEATKKAEELTNKAKELKSNYRILESSVKKYEELKEARYDSAEAAEEYQTAVEDLADKFPELISSFDASGNAVLEATNMEATLTKARQAAAEAAYNAAIQEREKAKLELQNKQQSLTEKQHNVGTYWSRSSDNANIALGTVINSNGDKTALIRDTNIGAFPVKETLQTLKEQNKLNIYTEELYNRLEKYQGSSYQLIHSLFNDINHGDIKTAQQSIILMRTLFDTMGWTLTKDFESQLTSLTNMLSEVAPLESSIEIANKTAVDSWIKKSDAYNKTPFIRDNSSLLTILENRLYNLAKEADDFSEGKLVNLGSPLISSLTTLWSNLNDQTQKQVDNIINNSENYTSKDLKTILGNAVSLAPEWLYDIFDQQTKNIQANLRNKLNLVFDEKSRDNDAYNTVLDFINNTNQEFTLNEQKFLISILDQIDNINQSGFNANGLASASTTLISQISGLTTDARNALLNKILTNGFSAEGWKKTLDYIESNTEFNFKLIDTNEIDTIIQNSVPNYSLTAKAAIGNIEETWSDLNKFFSSLQKGVNKTEVNSLLNQAQAFGLGENLEEADFISNGENVLISSEKLETLINQKKDNLKTEIDNLIYDLQDTYDLINDSETPMVADETTGQLNENFVKNNLRWYQRILGEKFNKYFKYDQETKSWQAILDAGETANEAEIRIREITNTRYENILSDLNATNTYYDILFNNLSKSLKWKRGDYSSLLDTKLYASVTDVETRLLDLASGIDELSDDELKQPDVAAARDQVREAYNKLISDIFDKGIENIKLSDYEGIIGISQKDITGTYENFILTYAKRANYSIKQMNEAWLNAVEKDNAKYSNDAIKDLQFINENQFQASSSELKDLAERFNVDLSNEQVRQFIHYNKDLGEFIVDWTNISELKKGLPEVSGYEDTIHDSINSFFDSLVSLIKNALTGSISNTEASKLSVDAKQYLGVTITDADFTKTADGLKLSTESALKLYMALSQTNALQKKLVFKELKTSLEENNEHYKDANALLTHTLRLEREIADIRSDGNKDEKAIVDSMTQELILAREILATRLIGKDTSWDFMSQDQLPDSIDNAISYWSSWANGIQDVASWAKTGNVDINKFSSMLKHVMDIAQATGETFQFMGAQIGGENGKTWNEFISGFYNALDFDEQGNAIFNLEKLKELGYDVSMGIEGISKELQDAVGTYAQENAKRLASFETFYDGLAEAYEKVKNSRQKFIDDNGDFNASDFAKYLQQNEKSMSSFYTFAETIQVNGRNLADLLRNSNTDWTKASQNYKALKGIYEMMMADDWDASQGYQAIIDHLSTSGFSGELTMGDMIFEAKSGKVIIKTLDSKGNVRTVTGPDGTEYPDAETAWQAIKEKELNDYIKEFAPEQENPKELTYTIAGLTYTIKVEGDHFILVRDGETIEGNFENIPEAFNKIAEDSTAVDLDQIKDIADREGAKKVQAGLQEMSDKGKQTYIQKGGEKRNDFSNATFGLNYNGIYSEAALANAQGKTAEQLQQQFAEIWNNTSLTDKQKVAEVQVQMGIDVDPEKVNEAYNKLEKTIDPLKVPIDWKAMAQQAELTSGATDVLSGITAAFSGESGIALGKTFGQGIAEGIQEALNKNPVEPVTESPTSPTNTGDNNGEGETVIISTYDDSASNKNELLKDWTVAIGEYNDEGATKPEVEPVTQNIKIEENATGDALDENTQVASAGLVQDIKLNNNDTEAALKNNDTLADSNVNQDIKYTVNAVNTAIMQNVADAKNNPAIQELRVTGGGSSGGHGFATGNVGPAKAGGTLIGELGPELVVSNGHYFVAGQNGAEFINLSSDAIVFNHLQTRSLLEKGMSNGRGRALTNERKAAAFAHGSGRALEGGSVLDAQEKTHGASPNWSNNMLSTIINNTKASKSGATAAKEAEKAIKAFIKEVDRWYNYLQEIARLERDITKEEKLRSEYQSHMTAKGKEYADSLLDTLPLLRQQAAENRLLANDQEKWLKGYVAEQADSPWAKFWTIDEHGQEKYNLAGFEKLEQMVGTDKYGKPNMTPEEQMAYLKSLGVTDEWFQYDSSGNAIDTSTPEGVVTAIQSLWEHMDKTRETVQTHLDSIDEHNKAAIDNQTTINGHLKSIEDNQIKVENSVLKAVEEIHQRMIDDVQDQRDAIEASSKALINGLSDQLSKEQDMYSRQQDSNELSTLQRRLSILQRSGGSASEIAKLQQEINSKQRDAYFEAQQSEIDTLQDAVDAQLERLDKQIELMTETLEYEKQNGLLWSEVYTVLNQTPDEITNFITTNTEEHWGKSPTELAQINRETLFQAEWFKEIIDRVGGVDNLVAENDYSAVDSELEKKVAETEKANAAAKEAVQATANAASGATNPSGSSNGSDIVNQYYQSAGADGHYLVAVHADGSKTGNKKQLQPHTFKNNKCTKCHYEQKAKGWRIMNNDTSAPVSSQMYTTKENAQQAAIAMQHSMGSYNKKGLSVVPVYDIGGMVEQDGPAFVHAKESVLTPEQTSILRNDILSNKPTSLLSLLTDFRDAYENLPGASAYNTTNNDGVVIQQATVEMHVNRIANDYDAQRAGEQALDQMLAIARKTQAQNRVGR